MINSNIDQIKLNIDQIKLNKSLKSFHSKTIVNISHNNTITEFSIINKMLTFFEIYEALSIDYISNLSYFNERKIRSLYIFVINLNLKIY